MSRSRTVKLVSLCVASMTLVGALFGWIAVDAVSRVNEAARVAVTAISTVEQTLESADATITAVDEGISGVDRIVAEIGTSSEQVSTVIADTSAFISTDVADSLEAVQQAMPALVDAATVIDSTLSTLALFGVEYDAGRSLAEAVAEVDDSLADLPDQLRVQGASLALLTDPVDRIGEETSSLALALAEMELALTEADGQLEDYRLATDELSVLVGETPLVTSEFVGLARAALVLFTALGAVASVAVWRLAPGFEGVGPG